MAVEPLMNKAERQYFHCLWGYISNAKLPYNWQNNQQKNACYQGHIWPANSLNI